MTLRTVAGLLVMLIFFCGIVWTLLTLRDLERRYPTTSRYCSRCKHYVVDPHDCRDWQKAVPVQESATYVTPFILQEKYDAQREKRETPKTTKLHIEYEFDPRYNPGHFAKASFEPDAVPVFAAGDSYAEAKNRLLEKYRWYKQKKVAEVPPAEDVEVEG